MIWIVIAIIVAALIIANAIRNNAVRKQSVASRYPIIDINDPSYNLAYKIIDSYLDVFFQLAVQADLTQGWSDRLRNSKEQKEKNENEKHVQESRKALDDMINNFWSHFGGYNKMLDPTIIPTTLWPKVLIDKSNAKFEDFELMKESLRQIIYTQALK